MAQNLSDLYDANFKKIRGKAAQGLIRPTLSQFFMSHNDFTKIESYSLIEATGGTITYDGDYKIHTFVSSGVFDVTKGLDDVEYLIVAGGGGGSMGGGGAGGLITGSKKVTSQPYTIVVGEGGNKSVFVREFRGSNGQNSSALGMTAYGGGGGGAYGDEGYLVRTGNDGGSGGGGGGLYTNQTWTAGGIGTPGQGSNGGYSGSAVNSVAGGGGGAGSEGADGDTSGNGGIGLSSYIAGSLKFYAGGGGGGATYGDFGLGGEGGGGDGGRYSPRLNASDGDENTGGGGGGASGTDAGNGGSGIIVLRYKYK